MDLKAGLDNLEERKFLILPGLELQLFSRPTRSQSLYRLRYHDELKRYTSRLKQSQEKEAGISNQVVCTGITTSGGTEIRRACTHYSFYSVSVQ
jgi:hypothetical protein